MNHPTKVTVPEIPTAKKAAIKAKSGKIVVYYPTQPNQPYDGELMVTWEKLPHLGHSPDYKFVFTHFSNDSQDAFEVLVVAAKAILNQQARREGKKEPYPHK